MSGEEGKKKAIMLGFYGIDSQICGSDHAVILEERLPEELEKKFGMTYIGQLNGVHIYKYVNVKGEKYIKENYDVMYG